MSTTDVACCWVPNGIFKYNSNPLPNTFLYNLREKLVVCAKTNPDKRILFYIVTKSFSDYQLKLLHECTTQQSANIEIIPFENIDFGYLKFMDIEHNCMEFTSFTDYLKNKIPLLSLPWKLEYDLMKLLILVSVSRPTLLFDLQVLPNFPIWELFIQNNDGIAFRSSKSNNRLTDDVIGIIESGNPYLTSIYEYVQTIKLNENTPSNLIYNLLFYGLFNREFANLNYSKIPNIDDLIYHDIRFKRIMYNKKYAILFTKLPNSRPLDNINLYAVEQQEKNEKQLYNTMTYTAFERKLNATLMALIQDIISKNRFMHEIRKIYSFMCNERFIRDVYAKFLFQRFIEIAVCKLTTEYIEVHVCLINILLELDKENRNMSYLTALLSRVPINEKYFIGELLNELCELLFVKWNLHITPVIIWVIARLSNELELKDICNVLLDKTQVSLSTIEDAICIINNER